nr:MAG: hypothetical protein 2 [Leviviridae sp.]
MALADPQSVTINAVAVSLPRTSQGVNTGAFTSADGAVKLTATHVQNNKTGRYRRTARLDHSKIASDPLTAENTEFSMSMSVIFDVPKRGYTVTEQKQVVDGFIAALNASSGALITKLLGGES